MKERFVYKKFHGKLQAILDACVSIIEDYNGQGYDLSVRQLFYQLVSKNLIANTQSMYKKIVGLVTDARLAGYIDWGHIVDRGRYTTRPGSYPDAATFMEEMVHGFRVDMWLNQPNYVEVMVEKQALEGVLEPVCAREDVAFSSNKGYSSSSALYNAGLRFRRRGEDKQLHIIYLGDHDPSGMHMTSDVDERVSEFARFPITIHRVALNMDQIKRFKPPENSAKMKDPRAAGYVKQFGKASWELDALEPVTLANIVRDKIDSLRDQRLWDERLEFQKAEQAKIEKAAKKLRSKKAPRRNKK